MLLRVNLIVIDSCDQMVPRILVLVILGSHGRRLDVDSGHWDWRELV